MKYIDTYRLPPPTKLLSKVQYKKILKKAVRQEARLEIRKQLLDSSKLAYLASSPQNQAPQMTMLDLERIRLLTRCRMGCHFSFSGDFGSGVRCGCGEIDTLNHVRRGCPAYADLLPGGEDERDWHNSVERAEAVYEAVLDRHSALKAAAVTRSCAPDPAPPPT